MPPAPQPQPPSTHRLDQAPQAALVPVHGAKFLPKRREAQHVECVALAPVVYVNITAGGLPTDAAAAGIATAGVAGCGGVVVGTAAGGGRARPEAVNERLGEAQEAGVGLPAGRGASRPERLVSVCRWKLPGAAGSLAPSKADLPRTPTFC